MAGRALPLAAVAGPVAVALVAAAVSLHMARTPPLPPAYPPTPVGEHVDTYHGIDVADPYRWLEDTTDPAVTAWVDAQNRLTEAELAALPGRAAFAARLRALLDVPRIGLPEVAGGTFAYRYNPGLAETDALWVTDDPQRPGRLLVDPLAIRADGTVSIGGFALSPDGGLLAYGLSDGGSDWQTWRFRRVADGSDLPEVIDGTRFTEPSFTADGRYVFYSRYPRGADGTYDDDQPVSVYRHRLGSDPAGDEPWFALPDAPTRNPYATVTDDGRYLVITVEDGYEQNGLYVQRIGPDGAAAGPVLRLLDRWDARYEFVGNRGDELLVLTTNAAPRGRVVAIRPDAPEPARWRVVVPESAATIESVALAGSTVLVAAVRDARSVVRRYPLAGGEGSDLALPGAGSVTGFAGRDDDARAWFAYTDFVTPRTLYALDATTGATTAVRPPPAAPVASDFRVEQVSYRSRDGTRVPLTLVRRADLPPGPRPTVLYGYGGFNVSLLPGYSAARMAWIEAGGTYAQANLRGGGEFGEEWHQAGTRLRKQNVFDDFIAAAEWLVAERHTTPAQLAIWGGSNGGLLVAAVLNQRPELFAAAVPAVGVLDMLRYQTASLNARQWSSDYGLSEDPGEFRALRAYSPYHNVRIGYCYPPVLVQADANDDRVVPWHSYKYAAALQAAIGAAGGCRNRVLLRTETRSGHGAGASVSKTVAEYADQWTFVAAATGLRR
jgi:prolyl oligopeptidase